MSEFIYFAARDLRQDIGTITQDQIKPFFSEGLWSMHDLMMYLLEITGPAKVWISTFSISEAAIRAIHLGIEKGWITEIHCFFDQTIRKHKVGLLFFANNIVNNVIGDISIGANHSKLVLIENDHWSISVVGSANMTPNPRKEAGVIFSDKSTLEFYKSHLVKSISEGLPATF